jgi:hypothetical protein
LFKLKKLRFAITSQILFSNFSNSKSYASQSHHKYFSQTVHTHKIAPCTQISNTFLKLFVLTKLRLALKSQILFSNCSYSKNCASHSNLEYFSQTVRTQKVGKLLFIRKLRIKLVLPVAHKLSNLRNLLQTSCTKSHLTNMAWRRRGNLSTKAQFSTLPQYIFKSSIKHICPAFAKPMLCVVFCWLVRCLSSSYKFVKLLFYAVFIKPSWQFFRYF